MTLERLPERKETHLPPYQLIDCCFREVQSFTGEFPSVSRSDFIIEKAGAEFLALQQADDPYAEILLQRAVDPLWRRAYVAFFEESSYPYDIHTNTTNIIVTAQAFVTYPDEPFRFLPGRVAKRTEEPIPGLSPLTYLPSHPPKLHLLREAVLLPAPKSMLLYSILNNLNIKSAGRELAQGTASNLRHGREVLRLVPPLDGEDI